MDTSTQHMHLIMILLVTDWMTAGDQINKMPQEEQQCLTLTFVPKAKDTVSQQFNNKKCFETYPDASNNCLAWS